MSPVRRDEVMSKKPEKTKGTKIYGVSDDLIEFEGDVDGEVGCFCPSDDESALIMCSDATVLQMTYGDGGIWKLRVLHKGLLLEGVDVCEEENDDGHSDVATFAAGLKWAYVGTQWAKAK